MSTLGQRLKSEREKRKLTIEKLAAETRIHSRHFEAIEEDRTADLPSGFFYRSFVRQYARILGLPESDYMPEIQRSLDAEAEQTTLRETALPQRNIDVPPMPTGRFNAREETKRWMVRLALLVVVLAGSSGLYYLYQRWRLAPAESSTAVESVEPAASRPAIVIQPSPKVEQGAAAVQTPAEQPAQQQASNSPTPAQMPPPTSEQPEAPAPLNLTIVASADAWLQLTVDGKTVFMDILRTGQSRSFKGSTMMRLKTGNAGGVSMEFNGAAVPPAGPVGQVRTVEFTSQGARVITPPVVAPEVTPLAIPRQEQQN